MTTKTSSEIQKENEELRNASLDIIRSKIPDNEFMHRGVMIDSIISISYTNKGFIISYSKYSKEHLNREVILGKGQVSEFESIQELSKDFIRRRDSEVMILQDKITSYYNRKLK